MVTAASSVNGNNAERQQQNSDDKDDDEDDNAADWDDDWRHAKLTRITRPTDGLALRYHWTDTTTCGLITKTSYDFAPLS